MKKYKLVKKNNYKLVNGSLTLAILALSSTIIIEGYSIHKSMHSEPKVVQVIDAEDLFKPINEPVKLEPDVNIVHVNNNDIAAETINPTFIEQIEELKLENETDPEIKDEIDSEILSIYFEKLEEINQNNPISGVNMEQYMCDNYKSVLYDENAFNDNSLNYAALAYKRLIDADVDICAAVNELNTIMELQLNPTELDDATYNEIFKTLLQTINTNEENVYDIYFPLAKQVHIVNCNYSAEQHYIASDGITYCDELVDQEKTK